MTDKEKQNLKNAADTLQNIKDTLSAEKDRFDKALQTAREKFKSLAQALENFKNSSPLRMTLKHFYTAYVKPGTHLYLYIADVTQNPTLLGIAHPPCPYDNYLVTRILTDTPESATSNSLCLLLNPLHFNSEQEVLVN